MIKRNLLERAHHNSPCWHRKLIQTAQDSLFVEHQNLCWMLVPRDQMVSGKHCCGQFRAFPHPKWQKRSTLGEHDGIVHAHWEAYIIARYVVNEWAIENEYYPLD
jgi:hypothetical protein